MSQNIEHNTASRKDDHLRICLENDVKYTGISTGFEHYSLIPNLTSTISPSDIDLTSSFLGKALSYPIIISGMTGGSIKGKEINNSIAKICAEFNIGMGVGSQRAAIENSSLEDSFKVRENLKDQPLLANLGIGQFSSGYGIKEAHQAIEMIEADGLALHINPLQELIQYDGDKEIRNLKESLQQMSKEFNLPLILKGVGTGFSLADMEFFNSLDVYGIDIAGAGGTNWKKVEQLRNPKLTHLSTQLINWGVPTAECLNNAYSIFSNSEKKIIASGGIWSGLDAVKALIMGADYVAFALPILLAYSKGSEEGIRNFIENYILEMKIVFAMLESKNLEEIKKKKSSLMRKSSH